MMLNILIGFGTMAVCLALQIALLTRALFYYARHQSTLEQATFLSTLSVLNGVMLLLVLGNLGQIALWALLYLLLGEFADYATAFYHSAVNFSTLGYGDIVMSEARRLLGPMQSMNGVLMVGISTAAFMTTLRDALTRYRIGDQSEEARQIQSMVDRGQ
jgi:hypothetical protein